MVNLKLRYSLIFLFSLFFVFGSLGVSRKGSVEQGKDVHFGYPFAFIGQNFEKNDIVNYYQNFNFKKSLLQNKFFIDKFFVSLAIVFIITGLIIYIIEFTYFNLKELIYKLINKNKKV